jgi:hypothetical protein
VPALSPRTATLGFSDKASFDDGAMWPIAFALTELTAADEAKDRRAREESVQLRTELAAGPRPASSTQWTSSPGRLRD